MADVFVRCMHGLLRAEGVRVCQQRVGDSLRRTFPFQHSIIRRNVRVAVNPVPYRANYFGEKLNFDQNENLVMYGVTHVLAVDGYSRKIVRKNPITIYNTVIMQLRYVQYRFWQLQQLIQLPRQTEVIMLDETCTVSSIPSNFPIAWSSLSEIWSSLLPGPHWESSRHVLALEFLQVH